MKVLIIEDEKENIDKLVRVIRRMGHESINPGKTKSVEQAVEFIRAHNPHNPDVILLDMNFSAFYPDDRADGCKVVQQLTHEEREKIICASATPDKYVTFLRPLGIRHFGGKWNFGACLTNTCKCE